MRLTLPGIIIFGLLLTGCTSRIPEPIAYEYSQQYKMQAAHHWQVLAADLANRINNQLILTDNIDRNVFVQETCGDESKPCPPQTTSSFNEAFRDFLITDLVAYGIPTNKNQDDNSLELFYKVQIVRHNADRIRTLEPGVLTALTTAIVVMRNAPDPLLAIAGAAGIDTINASLSTNGHYEVIITTSMIQRGHYLFRTSDIYYINDKDFWQYQTNMQQATKLKLTSGDTIKDSTLPTTNPPNPFVDSTTVPKTNPPAPKDSQQDTMLPLPLGQEPSQKTPL